jgi:AcrR family transcriptional regulator
MKRSCRLPAEKRRAQLINAGIKVFSRKGYEGATTEEIARAAGLTKGALYFHFDSKEEVFFEVIKALTEYYHGLIYDRFSGETNARAAFEALIRFGLEEVAKKKHFTLEFWKSAQNIRKIREYLEAEEQKLEDRLIDHLNSISNINRRQCRALVTLVSIIFDGIIVRQSGYKRNIDLNSIGKDIMQMTRLYIGEK